MKISLVFLTGIIVGTIIGLFVFLPKHASAAESDTSSLESLVPDIETMYKNAFTAPFLQAQDKIYDPDIADYYRHLLNVTGITDLSNQIQPPATTAK